MDYLSIDSYWIFIPDQWQSRLLYYLSIDFDWIFIPDQWQSHSRLIFHIWDTCNWLIIHSHSGLCCAHQMFGKLLKRSSRESHVDHNVGLSENRGSPSLLCSSDLADSASQGLVGHRINLLSVITSKVFPILSILLYLWRLSLFLTMVIW